MFYCLCVIVHVCVEIVGVTCSDDVRRMFDLFQYRYSSSSIESVGLLYNTDDDNDNELTIPLAVCVHQYTTSL